MLQRGEGDEIDRLLEQLHCLFIERKEIRPVDEGILLDGENRAQRVGDRAVLPFVARGDLGLAASSGRTIQSPPGVATYGTAACRTGRSSSTPICVFPFRGVRVAFIQSVANQPLLQRDLLGARVEVERRAVDEILEPVGRGVALRVALRLELVDLFDDGRDLGDRGRRRSRR